MFVLRLSTLSRPAQETVSFQAKDTAGRYIVQQLWNFCPFGNFASAQYNATTDWTLNFSEGGSVINIKAYDGSHNKISVEGSQQITVAEGSFSALSRRKSWLARK